MMPFTIFMILGIIQLSLMQQARLLTQYAAFRAARAGSLGQADCKKMTDAAVEGILPSFGRTDDAKHLQSTWTTNVPNRGFPQGNSTNISGSTVALQKLVNLSYIVESINGGPVAPYDSSINDFDDPGHGYRLSAHVSYNYEMRIPFANWMIHEMWTGGNYFHDSIDMLSPSKTAAPGLKPADLARIGQTTDKPGTSGGRYFLPLPASSMMRMMSNPASTITLDAKAVCP